MVADTDAGDEPVAAGDYLVMPLRLGNRDEAAFGPTAGLRHHVGGPLAQPRLRVWAEASASAPPWPGSRVASSSRRRGAPRLRSWPNTVHGPEQPRPRPRRAVGAVGLIQGGTILTPWPTPTPLSQHPQDFEDAQRGFIAASSTTARARVIWTTTANGFHDGGLPAHGPPQPLRSVPTQQHPGPVRGGGGASTQVPRAWTSPDARWSRVRPASSVIDPLSRWRRRSLALALFYRLSNRGDRRCGR